MIIDWSTMKPHICGEGEDAVGFRFGYGVKEFDKAHGYAPYRVNTLTGEVDCFRYPFRQVADENGEEQLESFTMQLVPPITVWLYT